MNRLFYVVACSVLLAGVPISSAFSQGPSKFYEQDYAHTPFKDNNKKAVAASTSNSNNSNASSGAVVEQETDTPQRRERSRSIPGDPSNVMDDSQGNPILSIGLIVDAANSASVEEVSKGLISVLDKHDIMAGEIYSLAGLRMLTDMNMDSLRFRGATIRPVKELPKRYSEVKLSPTYLIETGDGEIILEAVSDLTRFINSKGEFLDDPNPLQGRSRPARPAKPF